MYVAKSTWQPLPNSHDSVSFRLSAWVKRHEPGAAWEKVETTVQALADTKWTAEQVATLLGLLDDDKYIDDVTVSGEMP